MEKYPRWSDEEIRFIKENYTSMTDGQMAKFLNRTKEALKEKRTALRIAKRKHSTVDNFNSPPFSEAEIKFLRQHSSSKTINAMRRTIKRSSSSIRSKCKSLGLDFLREANRNIDPLTDAQIDYLKENYNKQTVPELAKYLNKTVNGLKRIIRKLALKRSSDDRTNLRNTEQYWPDSKVAHTMAYGNKPLQAKILSNHPELVELKRHQLLLNGVIKKVQK